MTRRIHVIGVRKDEPDIKLYVLALIALARQLQAEEAAKTADQQSPRAAEPGPGEADHG